ncbi:MAG TPA: carboxypeptidase-like regulatory domain-containing protein, partial [Pyrinomonadaceae bacterium]|nr:carboxypeptidase-like regulatory domain-containing protein [Pyrinomonadaceae bacterium]
MLRTRRLVPLLIAILLAPYGYAHSTQAVAQVSEAGTKLGSIKGRVLSDGQAVTNASVRVSSVNSPRQYRAVPTNDNGDFEVKGLESGMYRVQASAPAYVSLPVEPDEEIHRVGDSVTVNMIRGGVITGKVLTTDDEPLVAVRVRAMMIRDASGRQPTSTMPSMERLTDDRGNYRIFGLLPGTYVVYAGGRGFSGTGANAYDNDAPTFAPSSARDTAEEISLAGGEERTADIRYRGSAGHSVSGKVNAPTTPNSPWIEINLARVVNSTLDFRVSTFQNAGAKGFEFQGVADGDYSIWSQYASSTGETLVSETKRITVRGADVTGIELIARPLASVAGAVVLEPSTIAECKDKRRPLFEETLVSVQRTKSEPRKEKPARDSQLESLLYSSSQASPDGTGSFQLRNLGAGQYDFK